VILTDIPALHLQHDEPLSLLRMAWAGGLGHADMRAPAGQLLDLARQLGVRSIVFDLNQLPNVSTTDEQWLCAHWVPVLARLPLERIVLVINYEQIHNQLVTEDMLAQLPPDTRLDVQYFSEADAALDWLSDGSPRLPALLAEWAGSAAQRLA